MTDKQWAPEPWKPCNNYKCHDYATGWIEASDGEQLGLQGDDGWEGYHISQAERDRIIACVNACQGVPTERLLQMTKGSVETACPVCGAITHSNPLPADVQQRRLRCMWCHKIFPSSDSKGATDAT